jgi:hypothetical protein
MVRKLFMRLVNAEEKGLVAIGRVNLERCVELGRP